MQNSSKNNNSKILQASIDLKTRSIHFLNKLTEKCKNETKGPDLGPRWVRLAPNEDKSRSFQDQISNLTSRTKNEANTLKT